ncbi:MAG: glycerophosphodiester phosphodiesterase family protein [Verrucomicrobia bacterium]|nr:glycerophosphodiester phosphodiesterase family protein [Verrucomicrobiota bacterium]
MIDSARLPGFDDVIPLDLQRHEVDSQWMENRFWLVSLSLACWSLIGLNAGTTLPVSRLEAVHVAEIHSGRVASEVRILGSGAKAHYLVTVGRGDSFAIDANHGRLVEARRRAPGESYRWPGIRVVAHRGGVSLGPPENTLPAISKAIEVGADLIEVDIRESSDGHLVLMHDRSVDRTTDGKGRVENLTLAEILKLEVKGSGDEMIRVPRIEEALRLMKGRIDADLDFKEGDLMKLITAVRNAGMEDHVTMHSSWERCAMLVDLEPRIRIRPTVDHSNQVRDLISRIRPAMVNFDWHSVTEASVRSAHLGGCLAFVNCLGSADTDFYVREAIRIGADYIQSDRPDRVLEILAELGLRREGPVLGSALDTPLRHNRLGYPH